MKRTTFVCFVLLYLENFKWVSLGETQIGNQFLRDGPAEDGVSTKKLGPCTARVEGQGVVSLQPLARTDGYPRFYSIFQNPRVPSEKAWNYTFNPCVPYNEPKDLHNNAGASFGDICSHVTVCKFNQQGRRIYYYPYGVQTNASPEFKAFRNKDGRLVIMVLYDGIRTQLQKKTKVELICNRSLYTEEEGRFLIKNDDEKYGINAELHHICACPDECVNGIPSRNFTGVRLDSTADGNSPTSSGSNTSKLLFIIGVNLGILILASCVGIACYKQKNRLYNKVPNRQYLSSPQTYTAAFGSSEYVTSHRAVEKLTEPPPTDYQDYEPDAARLKKKLHLPTLENHVIPKTSLELSQRLGGGTYSDTNVGHYTGYKVAVTRITLRIHDNQVTKETLNWMKEEVWILSRQRHRHIVPILGICVENRLPYIISEFVEGQSVKYVIQNNADTLQWPQKVKISSQAADGMAYLHTCAPPILHRDLRCANIFISENENVKVGDFGVTKLIQPLREVCKNEECCCQGRWSSCPPSIRWTAPEVLKNPVTHETDSDSPLTIYSDVYSFGVCMWELARGSDPFSECTEQEVCELVKRGSRPDSLVSMEILPQYKALMHQCWNSIPDNRPKFKQIATRLKDLMSSARSYQKNLSAKKRQKKLEIQMDVKT